MATTVNIHYAEGKHIRKGGCVRIRISEETFKDLTHLGFEARRGDVCLVMMNDAEYIHISHVVNVTLIDAPEEECIEIHDCYALAAE